MHETNSIRNVAPTRTVSPTSPAPLPSIGLCKQDTLSSREVAAIAGVTLRQLQWWNDRGIVPAELDGHRRCYSPVDVRCVRIVSELRRKGMSLQSIRRVMKKVRRQLPPQESFLITDGHGVLFGSAAVVCDVMTKAKGPMYVLLALGEEEGRGATGP